MILIIYLELKTIICRFFQFLKTDVIYMWQLTELAYAKKKEEWLQLPIFDGCVLSTEVER